MTYRKKAVEAAGGRFVDLRDLLPGESLAYFNDFVHPSEVGYELLARGLCEQMAPAATQVDGDAPAVDQAGGTPVP